MMTVKSDIANLQVILEDDVYFEMGDVGVEEDGWETVHREDDEPRRWSRTVRVVTRSPGGLHYQWQFEEGLTEYQESDRPDTTIVPVTRVEETVVVERWVAI